MQVQGSWPLLTLLLAGACATGTTADTGSTSGSTSEGWSASSGGSPVDAGVNEGGSDTGAADAGPCVTARDCDMLDSACTEGACVNGQCSAVPANELAACEDGLFCTLGDSCQAGICIGGGLLSCPSADICHIGTCDEEAHACVEPPGNDGARCTDKNPCTYGVCSAGACIGVEQVDCSFYDGPCVVGICDPILGCQSSPLGDGTPCDDGEVDPCKAGVCLGASCISKPANDGAPCDDGLFCTEGETCGAGTCGSGTSRACTLPDGCWVGACDEGKDACVAIPGADGVPCDDGNPCTAETACSAGACVSGSPANEGIACEDGVACTVGEKCNAGKCEDGVGPRVFLVEHFSEHGPGWTRGPGWEVGAALVSEAGALGADPAFDHTPTSDNGLAGMVIGGNAPTDLPEASYLESPAFDASGSSENVVLGFYRWLNSDVEPFMSNAIEVFDGTGWVPVWTSDGEMPVQDSPPEGAGWTYLSYDLTPYRNAAMRIRFGFRAYPGALPVGSWNVDDVLVLSTPCP